MSQLLKSILSSYSTLTTIAGDESILRMLPSIDITNPVTFIDLWQNIMTRIQTTLKPSLHLVVI